MLERREPAIDMARFYVLSIEETLFGDTALVREWGRIGLSALAGWICSRGEPERAKRSNSGSIARCGEVI